MLVTACSNSGGTEGASNGNGSTNSGNEKPAELVFAFLNTGTMADVAVVQDAINKITKEKINATVKLLPIDSGAWTQQINLLLSGNEPLDLVLTSSFFNFNTQVAKGQLIQLDDLLQSDGQGIEGALQPEVYNGTKIKGATYGISSFREIVADYGFVARKDLLDKYNIDLGQVKTYADLEPIFQTIKDNEPGVTPLLQRGNTNGVAAEMLSSSVDNLGDGLGVIMMNDNNTKVVNLYETKQYEEAVLLARKWSQAGYIMKDAATTQESNTALMKAGTGFGYLSNMKPDFERQETELNGMEMKAVRLSEPFGASSGPIAFMLSIPSNSKNPNKAMQLMNLFYTDADVMNLLTLGIEGKHYIKNESGQVRKAEGESGYVFNQWEVGNNALTLLWEGADPEQWEKLKEFNRTANYSPALGFMFDAANVKTEIAAVTNVLNQYKDGLESGAVDPKVLPEFIKKLKEAGIDKIIAEKQTQLDDILSVK
jgi:putative aldouronate transport system substrate-binding protein